MLSSLSLMSSKSNTSSSLLSSAFLSGMTCIPSSSSSMSTIWSYASFLFIVSGFFVSTQPSSTSISNFKFSSSWSAFSSAILFSHGTPLVTKYCFSAGRLLFYRPSFPDSHLNTKKLKDCLIEREVFRFRFKKLDMFVLIIESHDKNTYAFII